MHSTDHFERVTAASDRSVRVEHELRYQWASSAIRSSGKWIDLGCGTGIGVSAIDNADLEKLVLVDVSEEALEAAIMRVEQRDADVDRHCLDLSDAHDLAKLEGELRSMERAVITCFEVIEHLESYDRLIEVLARLVKERDFTCFISVPNDAFFGAENPFHLSKWSKSAFHQLVQFLPGPVKIFYQGAVSGSAIESVSDDGTWRPPLELPVAPNESDSDSRRGPAPSHFLASFGSLADFAGSVAAGHPRDEGIRRAWERQRESDCEYFRTRLFQREEEVALLQARIAEMEARD